MNGKIVAGFPEHVVVGIPGREHLGHTFQRHSIDQSRFGWDAAFRKLCELNGFLRL